jgi:hypothetical protein
VSDTIDFALSDTTQPGFGAFVRVSANGSPIGDDAIPTGTATNYSYDLPSGGTDISVQIAAGSGCASDTVTVEPTAAPAVDPCEEYGRVTRAYVSGYQLNRVHKSSLLCGATRCLALNFNGAISASRSIVSAEFKCNQPFAVVMSNPQITTDGRECHCTIYAQNQGTSLIQANATLDNGDVYNQLFVVNVSRPAYFQNDPVPVTGPYVLTVSA